MTKPKDKDPKKVAAGKALARKNKEAREAKKKLDDQQSRADKGGGFFDSISIGTVVGVGGLLLGGANLYLRWSEDNRAEAPTQSVEGKTLLQSDGEKEEPPRSVEKKAESNEMIGMEI